MNDYYVLDAARIVKEYIYLDDGLDDLEIPCESSEFQFLDKKVLSLEADPSSGNIFQDFMYFRNVPIISDKMMELFIKENIDYLFYKKILITKKSKGVEELYWLALPPRINCLNRDKSNIDEVLNCADEIVINDSKVGNYHIFKLSGVTNHEIIITKYLAEKIKSISPVGVHIYELR